MSPVEIALLLVCAVTLLAVAGVVVAVRRLASGTAALAAAIDHLGEQVAELSRREDARVATGGEAQEADWVITFDEEAARRGRTTGTVNGSRNGATRAARNDGPGRPQATASTHQVVSTTLGEPMIKVSAFSHGVRQALREERRAQLAFQVRREYRRRRKMTRARVRVAQRVAQRAAQRTPTAETRTTS
jgi:hypothetical protein